MKWGATVSKKSFVENLADLLEVSLPCVANHSNPQQKVVMAEQVQMAFQQMTQPTPTGAIFSKMPPSLFNCVFYELVNRLDSRNPEQGDD